MQPTQLQSVMDDYRLSDCQSCHSYQSCHSCQNHLEYLTIKLQLTFLAPYKQIFSSFCLEIVWERILTKTEYCDFRKKDSENEIKSRAEVGVQNIAPTSHYLHTCTNCHQHSPLSLKLTKLFIHIWCTDVQIAFSKIVFCWCFSLDNGAECSCDKFHLKTLLWIWHQPKDKIILDKTFVELPSTKNVKQFWINVL